MAQRQSDPALADLPDACLDAVLRFLPATDLLAFQATCTRFRDVGRAPPLWVAKLRADYGLRLGWDPDGPTLVPQRLYESLHAQAQPRQLRFEGLLTDGGMDGGQACFWCSNMFESDRTWCYSSEMCRNQAVVVMAGLAPEDPPPRRPVYHLYPLPAPRPAPLPAPRPRLELASWRLPGDLDAPPVIYDRAAVQRCSDWDRSATGVAQSLVVSREGPLSCPVRCGAVLLANRPDLREGGDAVDADGEGRARELYAAAQGRFVDAIARARSAEALMDEVSAGRLPRAMARQRSAHGEWVQFDDAEGAGAGELRPLVWFRFFSRDEARAARQGGRDRRPPPGPPADQVAAAQPMPIPAEPAPAEIPDLCALSSPSSSGGMAGLDADRAETSGANPPGSAGSSSYWVADQPPTEVGAAAGDQAGPSGPWHPAGAEGPGDPPANGGDALDPVEHLEAAPEDHVTIAAEAGADDALSVDSAQSIPILWPGEGFYDGLSDENEWDVDFDEDGAFAHLFNVWNPQFFKVPEGEGAGTSGRNKLMIKLAKPASGNLLCVLLIDSENLMSEYMDDHEVPNIDINYVHVKGVKATIPSSVKLLA